MHDITINTSKRVGPLGLDVSKHGERLLEAAPTALTFLQTFDVPIEKIWFWPNNHNEMDEATFKGECESILMYDFVDPTFVRPFSEEDLAAGIGEPGCVEMIDGEHRTRVVATFIEQGFPEGVAIPPGLFHLAQACAVPAFIMPMSRAWASRIRLAISELHGKKDYRKLGELVAKISETVPPEELRLGTPWTVQQVQEMISMGRFDWKGYEDTHGAGGSKAGPDDGLFNVALTIPKGQRDAMLSELAALQSKYGIRFKEKVPKGKK